MACSTVGLPMVLMYRDVLLSKSPEACCDLPVIFFLEYALCANDGKNNLGSPGHERELILDVV